MDERQRYLAARNVTLWGALANIILAIIKVVLGILGRSHALFADGIHSFSDLLTDILVLFASHFGSKGADWDHPYGHARIETMATTLLAVLLIVAGSTVAYDSFAHLLRGATENPKFYVLWVALISIIVNEGLYRYTLRVSHRIQSQLLYANAWHHRSDAASSVVVLIGIIGALLGYTYLDAIAAVIVGVMIIKMGVTLGWSSVRELVDTGVDENTLKQISAQLATIPGVEEVHQLRTRRMGGKVLVDVHILVAPSISVSEGHYIASHMSHRLRETFPEVSDVTVHVDPEDDEVNTPSRNLPTRQDVTKILRAHWQNCPGADTIKKINFHYLAGQLIVDIYLPYTLLTKELRPDVVKNCYREAVNHLTYIKSVEVFFY